VKPLEKGHGFSCKKEAIHNTQFLLLFPFRFEILRISSHGTVMACNAIWECACEKECVCVYSLICVGGGRGKRKMNGIHEIDSSVGFG